MKTTKISLLITLFYFSAIKTPAQIKPADFADSVRTTSLTIVSAQYGWKEGPGYKEIVLKTRISKNGTKRIEKGRYCNVIGYTTMTDKVGYIYGRERRFRRVVKLK